MTYKDYEDGSAILQLRRDMFKDEQTFESILKFLDLNKDNDLIQIQIDSMVRFMWITKAALFYNAAFLFSWLNNTNQL